MTIQRKDKKEGLYRGVAEKKSTVAALNFLRKNQHVDG